MFGKVWLWVAAGYKALLPIITSGLGSIGHRPYAGPDRPTLERVSNGRQDIMFQTGHAPYPTHHDLGRPQRRAKATRIRMICRAKDTYAKKKSSTRQA